MTEFADIRETLKKLEPILGSKCKRLWQLYLAAPDAAARTELQSTIRILADRTAKLGYDDPIRLPPPRKSALTGKYHVGTVLYPDTPFSEFGLRNEDLVKHVLIVGITGAGKTNLSFHLLRELASKNKPFLVFDWKRSYRALKQFPELRNLKTLTLGLAGSELKFNPLIPPPGTDPKVWMTMLVDVMSHVFFVGHGVEYLLRKGIESIYRSFGMYDGKTEYPTFQDLDNVLKKEFVRGREMLWMSSTKRVLASLTPGSVLWETLDARSQSDLDLLLKGPVVLEMDNLATLEKIFMVETILLWIYHYRKNQGRAKEFRHLLLIEEAHHVLSGSKEVKFGSETIMETILRMIREFGEGVLVIDQEPSKLSKSVLANTNCKICFNLGSGSDIARMKQSMILGDSAAHFIDQLKVGHAIVKLKERFHVPVLVRVPLVPLTDRLNQPTDHSNTHPPKANQRPIGYP